MKANLINSSALCISFLSSLHSCNAFSQYHAQLTFQGRVSFISSSSRIREHQDCILLSSNTIEMEISQESLTTPIPRSLNEALRVFFLQHVGPPVVVLSLIALFAWRLALPISIGASDVTIFAGSIIFWWFQEHALHQRALHSNFDWYGKRIHQEHHDSPYYHVSIDPGKCLLIPIG